MILIPTTGDVSFHVTCESIPCADAYITINTIQYGPTNGSGIVIVTGLPPGPTNYTVSKSGYYDGSNSVNIIVGLTVDAPVVDLVIIPTDICEWIISRGEWHAITAYDIMLLVDAYLGLINFGFTVRMQDINGCIAYYLNILESGNSFTGCLFTYI